ncbi:MAG: DUF5690 family protein [Hyphomonas sp.]
MSVLQSGKSGRRAQSILFVLYTGGAAFAAYFAMYAFRKPFTAANFENVDSWGWGLDLDFKIALVIAQVIGYAASKFIGVKIVSEMGMRGRAAAIVGLITVSWLALILFAILPNDLKPLAMFLNGLPLGMIWGLVFGYIEGRRTSEILGAILCASFIVSSGMVKSVGVWLMNSFAVTEFWMPAATGALFFPLLLVSTFGLSGIPPPGAEDVEQRTLRRPMNGQDRRAFLSAFWPGLVPVVIAYVLFTAIRDFRDNFAAEIWADLGYAGVSSVFTASEMPIAAVTLMVLGALYVIRNNRHAITAVSLIVMFGSSLIVGATYAFQSGLLTPLWWMILAGGGLYLAYTPFNAMFFDRLIAASGRIGNAGFLIYLADASGYAGSVILLLMKNFLTPDVEWTKFFIGLAYCGGISSLLLILVSQLYFNRRLTSN